jgi:hypothetical protein
VEYTAEELATLSDEERAALVEDAPDIDALKAIAGEDEVIAAADETVVAADEIVAVAEEVADESEFTTQYVVAPVEGYDDKMAAFKEQKTDLRKQLNDGDLSLDEYDAKKDDITAQEQELREQKLKADIAAEQNEQTAQARWKWEQERFFNDDKNAIYKDDIIMAAYDKAVRTLGGDEANANRSGQWFLNEADRIVREKFNLGKPAEVVTPDEKPDSRRPDLSVVPKTLANLPAAEIAKTGEIGEFDHLDKLGGLDLERAVGSLSDAARERYRASA